jgi:hypothetical protein
MNAIAAKGTPVPARTSAAYVSMGFTAATLVLLAPLHVLSPEAMIVAWHASRPREVI